MKSDHRKAHRLAQKAYTLDCCKSIVLLPLSTNDVKLWSKSNNYKVRLAAKILQGYHRMFMRDIDRPLSTSAILRQEKYGFNY